MKAHPFKTEIFHLDKSPQIISHTDKNYEAIPYLARSLFGLPEKCIFTQIAMPLDPRGYLDLYGEDPEQVYKLEKDGNGFSYHALACYFDHISFILEGDIDCILTPEEEGIKLQILDEGAEDPIIEKHIHKREDLINAVSGFLSAYRGQETEEI